VAAICLALFGLAVVRTGWGSHLLVVTMPLYHWRSRVETRRLRDQTALMPFGSVSQMLSLRRKVRNFVKARYPARLGNRQIRSPVTSAAMWLHTGVVWLMFSPVVLAFQLIPEPQHRWQVTGS
jgi:hypothetical protein